MSQRHQYFGIENLGLTAGQRQALVQEMQGLGRAESDDNPARRNHWHKRPDNEALIFEAVFEDGDLTIAAFKARLAAIFGVAVGSISSSTSSPTFTDQASTVVTFTYATVARLRAVAFGGAGATWEQSRVEANGYLAANAAAWDDPL